VTHYSLKSLLPGFLSLFKQMAKSKKQTKRITIVSNNKRPKGKKGAGKARPSMPRGILSDPRIAAYDRLLRDPCASDLTYPPYSGADTGYLVRTVDYLTGTGIQVNNNGTATSGTIYPITLTLAVQPFNYSGGANSGLLFFGNGPSGITVNFAYLSPATSNFITTATVKRYRPVAACLKWEPSGPYTSRQGVVASGYYPGAENATGDAYPGIGNYMSTAQHTAANGAEVHEVRWLPTAVDENFTSTSVGNNAGCGTMIMSLNNVDGTGNGTAILPNGAFTVTVVWEWVPAATAAITVSPKTPLPYNTQQVLSTIDDLGAYIFKGVRSAASAAAHGLIRGGAQAVTKLITGGVYSDVYRGSSMPRIMAPVY
jgi:hypothetical protein